MGAIWRHAVVLWQPLLAVVSPMKVLTRDQYQHCKFWLHSQDCAASRLHSSSCSYTEYILVRALVVCTSTKLERCWLMLNLDADVLSCGGTEKRRFRFSCPPILPRLRPGVVGGRRGASVPYKENGSSHLISLPGTAVCRVSYPGTIYRYVPRSGTSTSNVMPGPGTSSSYV